MSTLASKTPAKKARASVGEGEPRAVRCWFADDMLWLELADSRQIGVPLSYYPTLQLAAPDVRQRCRLIARGEILHWPDIDYDLTTEGVVNGAPEFTPRPSPHLPASDRKHGGPSFLEVRRSSDGRWGVSQPGKPARAPFNLREQAYRYAVRTAHEERIWYVHLFNERGELVRSTPVRVNKD